ncbi:MAG: bifunctional aspartate kinase/homoserine dehydrogenase I, partial [Bacteroidetes bacterium]
MTADPRIVKTAKAISRLSYEEAMELSHFGAKVIYPPTIQPVLKKGIPIKIKNTLAPEDDGTLITKESSITDRTVQGLTSINNLALVNLKGSGMVGVPKISYRLFRCFAKQNINIILITQASSEHTISIVITEEETEMAAKAVNKEFAMEIELGKIDRLEIEKELAIVALVGSNMQNQVGVSGKMFSTLGANGVNIKAIAQGSSERNISTVIHSKDLKKALNSLHEDFFLSERKRINLFIIGVGNVGGELLLQLKNQIPVLLKEEHLDIRVVGLANSKKMQFQDEGITLSNWPNELNAGEVMRKQSFIDKMIALNLRNSVFIDNTATGDIPELYLNVLKSSISVVTPNKVAASASYDQYIEIKKTAQRYRTQFLFETNVGAGLPIISTLKDLVKSGDKVLAIEAVLSGSLNFIFNNYSGERDFSSVVKQAQKEGYTEPDPRIDLSGLDVKRKLLILMREAGIASEIEDIIGNEFMPTECLETDSINSFFNTLAENEDSFKRMYEQAQNNGCQLKFVAQYRDGKATTKLLEVGPEHPFYNLRGKDNIVLFYTRRYKDQPLIIKGAGAGAEVTASGIFADIMKVAHSKPYNL